MIADEIIHQGIPFGKSFQILPTAQSVVQAFVINHGKTVIRRIRTKRKEMYHIKHAVQILFRKPLKQRQFILFSVKLVGVSNQYDILIPGICRFVLQRSSGFLYPLFQSGQPLFCRLFSVNVSKIVSPVHSNVLFFLIFWGPLSHLPVIFYHSSLYAFPMSLYFSMYDIVFIY